MPDTEIKPSPSAGTRPEPPLTVLSEGDSLRGLLQMQGDGHLLGTFEGEVECEGELLIGREARVTADIRTLNITISGLVKGNLSASGRLKITATGRLEGDARVGNLIVQEGGVHHGSIDVHPEGLPAPQPRPAALPQPAPPLTLPAVAAGRPQITASVDRVKKMWGEFF